MNILDIVKRIDRTDKNLVASVDWDSLSSNLGCYLTDSEDTRLKAYCIVVWYCTDTFVGVNAHFLDDEFVCLSTQTGRKNGISYKYISQDAALKLRNYIRDLAEKDTPFKPNLIDLSEKENGLYSIIYGSQLIHRYHKFALDKNEDTVEIISVSRSYDYHNFHIVEVSKNGKTYYMDVRSLRFYCAKTFEGNFKVMPQLSKEEQDRITKETFGETLI